VVGVTIRSSGWCTVTRSRLIVVNRLPGASVQARWRLQHFRVFAIVSVLESHLSKNPVPLQHIARRCKQDSAPQGCDGAKRYLGAGRSCSPEMRGGRRILLLPSRDSCERSQVLSGRRTDLMRFLEGLKALRSIFLSCPMLHKHNHSTANSTAQGVNRPINARSEFSMPAWHAPDMKWLQFIDS